MAEVSSSSAFEIIEIFLVGSCHTKIAILDESFECRNLPKSRKSVWFYKTFETQIYKQITILDKIELSHSKKKIYALIRVLQKN